MKKDNFLGLPQLFILVIIFLINGCDFEKSKEEEIIGEWNAHWETVADENMPELKAENLKMDGLITFKDDGKVVISAFGFEGCIFSNDTMENTLNWKLDDTVLRFIDDGDEQGLPYAIKKFSSKELHLLLMEDIKLTLSRD